METYQKGGITIDYYGECFGKFDECITGFGEPFRNTKTNLSASFSLSASQCSDYSYHGFNGFNGSVPLNS